MLALNIIMVVSAVIALVSLIINMGGFDLSPKAKRNLAILDWTIVGIFISESFIKWGLQGFSIRYLRRNWPDFALIFLFLIILFAILKYTVISPQAGWLPLLVNLTFARVYLLIVRLFIVGSPIFRVISTRRRTSKSNLVPAQIVVLSFLFVIMTGTGFLLLPASTEFPREISFIDSLFTATSATCVTGLTVLDTGTYFSRFGQITILALIQIGGLGLMTITTFFSLILGKSMSIKESILMSDALNFKIISRLSGLIVSILILTFAFEALGTYFLYISWPDNQEFEQGSALYYSIFHSVSAFCNAGFSIFQDNLEGFRDNFILNMTITPLIIFGGLGFIVIMNIIRSGILRRERISLHTKLVVIVTASLIVVGTLLILMTEWRNSLKALPMSNKIMAAYFQSVTPRTAGFNTINIGNLTYACHFMMMILMFIGASPGGTGGGVKTSTFGILLGSVLAILKGRNSVEIFKRKIPRDIVNNAMLLIILSLMMLSVFGFILLFTQEGHPIHILFELFSAFGTVGLSAGVTPNLTSLGKMIIITTMFVGRVGPLTLVLAIGQQREKIAYEYPDEGVMIG